MPHIHEVPLSQSSRADKVTWTAFTEQLKGKLNRLRRAWGLLNNLISGEGGDWMGLGAKTQYFDVPRSHIGNENYLDPSIQTDSRRSRDEYEDSTYSESVPLNEPLVPLNKMSE
ncbi:hypothetical protein Salat_1427900 [Sesamum alatum]|uniref:Uncharacterized protein n=1 Tax=Sesamum alatum TaxID=300844 RepID=A0AAE1YAG4_9LAMI|nr:hypothetical protein Salat_1427900 [Sesamum alatum]